MSKFIFLLCTILLAGALANDFESHNRNKRESHSLLEKIKNKAVSVVTDASERVSERAKHYLETSLNAVKIVENESENFMKAPFSKIKEARSWVKSEVDKTRKEEINHNVTECTEMAKAFENTAEQAKAEVFQCFRKVINEGTNYMDKIKDRSEVVLKNLTDIKAEAELCVKDVSSLFAAARAVVCVNKAAAKGTWVATKNVPILLIDMERLKLKLTTLFPKLAICTTVNSVEKIHENSHNVIEKVKQCIKTRKELGPAQQKSE